MVKKQSILNYAVRRLLLAIPTIAGVVVLVFFLVRVAPGDPALALVGQGITATQMAALRESLGLDKPLTDQFVIFVTSLLRGDFGYSYRFSIPVWDILVERIPASLLLVATSVLFAAIIGVVLGLNAGSRPQSAKDHAITTTSVMLFSQPTFWTGMVFI